MARAVAHHHQLLAQVRAPVRGADGRGDLQRDRRLTDAGGVEHGQRLLALGRDGQRLRQMVLHAGGVLGQLERRRWYGSGADSSSWRTGC
ncbi:hypothetical protein WJ968_02635 [Achromobacter xylosoxidans]